jgi:hypothetical protein
MRSAPTFGSYPAFARLQAALLLAVVLTHLAFMASPLHVRLMDDGAPGVDLMSLAVGEATTAFDQWTTRDRHARHCIVEWLTADQRATLAKHLTVGLAPALLIPDLLAPGRRPRARALGPPAAGDSQALLQVFRE